ncbi:MAG TPA: DcaP family trimeric outer membrane transporter [Algoriphagus sp.]|nr:DcaP family trimeric outer membrane transporter [Algoriphagus sp.]
MKSIPLYHLSLKMGWAILLFCGLSISFPALAQENPTDKTTFLLYGFGRTNFVWDNQNLGRSDLFVPANIKVGEPKTPNLFAGAKQSRIGLDIHQEVEDEVLKIKLEGDFHNDATDATGLFRMRHAYASYRWVLVGMTWSNFFDEEVLQPTVDFEGPNSSTFSRTPQLRFSTTGKKSVFALSFENPLEKITLGGSVTALPERFPDLVGSFRRSGDFGFIKVAGLFRELRYQSDQPRSVAGYGITILGSIHVGEKDRLKFQGVTGTGVAQYIQGANGLNYDAVYNGTNELEALNLHASNISFQHYWKDHLYSSVTAGILVAEDNENLSDSQYKSGYYGAANIFWDPIKNLTFGWEALVGERMNIDRSKGTAIRLQMNATYKFNKSF